MSALIMTFLGGWSCLRLLKGIEYFHIVKHGRHKGRVTPCQRGNGEGSRVQRVNLFGKNSGGEGILSTPFKIGDCFMKLIDALCSRDQILRNPKCGDYPGIARNILGVVESGLVMIILVSREPAHRGFDP